jgi:hypothetical protein
MVANRNVGSWRHDTAICTPARDLDQGPGKIFNVRDTAHELHVEFSGNSLTNQVESPSDKYR